MTDAEFVPIEDMKSPPTVGLYLAPRTRGATAYIVDFHGGVCVDSVEEPRELLCIDGHPIRLKDHSE